jgi:methyl-accepting chemotaxis protein
MNNGRANGNGAYAVDHTKIREEAGGISAAVSRIVEITDQVSAGADAQVRSLDSALSGLNQITAFD